MSATLRSPAVCSPCCATGCSAAWWKPPAMLLGFVLIVWSLTPIYNMWLIALDSHDDDLQRALSGRQIRRWRASASSSPRTSGTWNVSGISSATASLSA